MKAHFSNIQSVILRELDKARHSIKIAVAWFTNVAMLETILAKCGKEKVIVDIILNNDEINNNGWTRGKLSELLSNHCRIHWIEYPELMHQKFCIIDSALVINGSYNWTNKAESHNRENIVLIDDPIVIEAFLGEFEKLCQLYPSFSELPPVGKSNIKTDVIQDIKGHDRRHAEEYKTDKVSITPISDWNGTHKLNFNLQLPTESLAILSFTDTQLDELLEPSQYVNGTEAMVIYDAKARNYIAPNRFFRLLAKHQNGKYHLKLMDGRSVMVNAGMISKNSSEAYIMLYSNYRIPETYNYHFKYRTSIYRIPISISVKCSIPIEQLHLSIEDIIGVKEEMKQIEDNKYVYLSPPDSNRYYIIVCPQQDCQITLNLSSSTKKVNWPFSLDGGVIYYLGYICNLSEKYKTERIYFKKGIKR